MRDMAVSEPDKTFRSLWKNTRQNPMWYAQKIFGFDVHTVPNASSLVDFGSETAYELTKVLKAHYAKKEKEPTKKAFPKAKAYANLDDLIPYDAEEEGGF
jgi:hypothetical protein